MEKLIHLAIACHAGWSRMRWMARRMRVHVRACLAHGKEIRP